MELPVQRQLLELLRALALGAGFGLLYDLLRPLRLRRWSAALSDGVWCLAVLTGLQAFALYAGGGRLRLFALAAMGLSGGLWLRLVSPLLRALGRLPGQARRVFGRARKRPVNFAKKL